MHSRDNEGTLLTPIRINLIHSVRCIDSVLRLGTVTWKPSKPKCKPSVSRRSCGASTYDLIATLIAKVSTSGKVDRSWDRELGSLCGVEPFSAEAHLALMVLCTRSLTMKDVTVQSVLVTALPSPVCAATFREVGVTILPSRRYHACGTRSPSSTQTRQTCCQHESQSGTPRKCYVRNRRSARL